MKNDEVRLMYLGVHSLKFDRGGVDNKQHERQYLDQEFCMFEIPFSINTDRGG